MNQGDVYWFTFPPPDKRRPVVVVTRQSALGFLTNVSVAPVTSTVRPSPTYVSLGPADGLPRESAINLDGIQTIPIRELGPYITRLSPAKLREVRLAIEFAFGLRRLR